MAPTYRGEPDRPDFVRVARVEEVPPGRVKQVRVDGRDVALVNLEGAYFALDNNCPHSGGPLAQGWLDSDLGQLTCPWHAWTWDVRSGRAVAPPVNWRAVTYTVRVDGGAIFVSREPGLSDKGRRTKDEGSTGWLLDSPEVRLYDSLRRQVEALHVTDQRVRMYVCGITPYDTTHLGHAFTYLIFDVLGRNLRRHGLEVTYVQNVTDVDDDMLRRARRDGRDWRQLAAENVSRFRSDLAALNVIAPDHYPYASAEIEPIQQMVSGLLERGHAYRSQGNVYFRVSSFPGYGELSRLGRQEMLRLGRQRGADPTDSRKEDPLDFILWQASAPDEPSWDAPWGAGRPGWHVECSAMTHRYLGDQIDIHGGGADLIYPHHESEIAQSESFTGQRPFARFWVHTAMVRYQGEKMSKSLGNMVFASSLRQRYSADAIRLYLLDRPYREAFEFDESELESAQRIANQISTAVSEPTAGPPEDPASDVALSAGLAGLDDDLDTSRAIEGLRQLLARPASDCRQRSLRQLGDVLGLTFAP
jgi:L-cysteine:1D-myo-inositol 2-amino-2-deoxy-alpha-D-glucopyranoside ligase